LHIKPINPRAWILNKFRILIRFVSKSGVNEVSIEQKDFKITIKTNQAPVTVNATVPAAQSAATLPAPVAASLPAATAEPGTDTSKYVTITSPMIGTFYRSASPDKPLFG